MPFSAETFRHPRPFHDVRHPHLPRGQTALYGGRGDRDAGVANAFTQCLAAVMLVMEATQNR